MPATARFCQIRSWVVQNNLPSPWDTGGRCLTRSGRRFLNRTIRRGILAFIPISVMYREIPISRGPVRLDERNHTPGALCLAAKMNWSIGPRKLRAYNGIQEPSAAQKGQPRCGCSRGLLVTLCWREMDSNFQFRERGTKVSIPAPFRCGASVT